MTNIILSGANGKMGQVIAKMVAEMEDAKICAGVDINTTPGSDYEVFDNPYEYTGDADAIIDFSHPDALFNLLPFAVSRKIPVVVATTGLTDEHKARMQEAAKEIPVFFSANMSVGVNLLIRLVTEAAKALEENYDIEIIEKHHHRKIDAPSGTALMIADKIGEALTNAPEYVYDRHAKRKKRDKNEIGISAVRGGTIVGEHTVLFAGPDEVLEVTHIAQSREIFAAGAIRAAKYIAGKPAGMYNMDNLLSEQRDVKNAQTAKKRLDT